MVRSLGSTHHLKHDPGCPVCGAILNGATGVDHDSEPTAGDVTMCGTCLSFLAFKPDMTLVLMTDEDVAKLDDEARNTLLQIRRLMKEVYRRKGLTPSSQRR